MVRVRLYVTLPYLYSMHQLGVLQQPPKWVVSTSQGYPSSYVAGTHLKYLRGDRQGGIKFLV